MKTDDQYTLITSSPVSQLDPGEFNESDLSLEERQRLAGLDEETQSLIAPEHRIDPEVVPVKRDLAQSPVSRTVFVLGTVGVFAAFGVGVSMIAGIGRSRQPPVAETPPATDSDVITPSDADLYKGRLALTEQQRDQQQQPRPAAPTATPRRPTPTQRTKSTPARPRPVPAAAPVRARPAPIPVAPRPAPPPRMATPRPAPMPQRTQPEVNPFDQWNRLATIGSASAEVAARPVEEVSRINSPERSPSSMQQTQTDFPADVIGDSSFSESVNSPVSETAGTAFADVAISPEEAVPPTPQDVPTIPQDVLIASSAGAGSVSSSSSSVPVSAGTRGILEQREMGDGLSPNGNYQVALGTSAAAEVTVPLYWESGGADQGIPGRFAVTLTQPLVSTNGEVALPAGTTFITEAQVSSDQSRIVNQTVVAVVYEGADGQIRQEPVTPGTIVVRGEDNRPLIARRHQNSDLGDDLLLGAVGALGRVGELINQGDVFSSSSSSGGSSGSSSTTITRRSGNTNVLAAALDGFFNPLVERMQSRAQAQNADRQSTILEVNEGQTVSVFVNGLLEVAP